MVYGRSDLNGLRELQILAFLRSRGGLVSILLLLTLLITACGGAPLEPSWGDLSVLDDNLVLAFSGTILQLNPDDGSSVILLDADGNPRTDPATNELRRWEVSIGGQNRFYQTPLVLDEATLLAPSYDRHLYTIEREAARFENTTGIELPGHIVAPVLETEDTLYVPLSEKNLLALNMEDYSQRWIFETQRGVWATPLLVDGVLYVTAMDHHMYAVNAETGEEIWRLDLGGAVASTPVLHEGSLYIGSFARKVYRISLEGQITAEYDTADWVWGSPAIVDNMLYTADLVGNVYALELTNDGFSQVWRQQVAARAIRPTPIVFEDRLIVVSRDHFVYWLNRNTGDTLVRQDVRGEVMAEPLLLEPNENLGINQAMLFVATMARDNLIFAFPADGNGEALWKYPR